MDSTRYYLYITLYAINFLLTLFWKNCGLEHRPI